MWTDEQLDVANYVSFKDGETNQFHNVGLIEVQGTAYQGPYIMTPAPPFGSLKNGTGISPMGVGVHVPAKRYSEQFQPRGFPAPQYNDSVVHFYGNGDC
jgi:hypothetical protein